MSLNAAQRASTRGEGDANDLVRLAADMANGAAANAITPVAEHPMIAKYLPWMVEVALGHPDRDEKWAEVSALDRISSITTPALSIGGWYDLFYGETLRAYTEMKTRAGSADARDGQRLIIGPWSHTSQVGFFPDRHFGPIANATMAMLTEAHVAFFDRWLKGRDNALDDLPPVRIFVMGIDQWRDEQDWPLPDTAYTPYYLDGAGPANTAAGSGSRTG